ncbi:acyltransferase family protein [Ligilactobacillus salivarius]|uniref:acyltransferase family protein n=1 Tax=Ligilactobacillus salivarius TaxID=1624 RepID=UPI0030F78D51
MNFTKNDTSIVKGMAILIVIVSHWYRYVAIDAPLHFIYHFGFYGAALFSFMSGYGVYKSYVNRGFYKNWIVKKIRYVYIPYMIICIIANVVVYKYYKFDISFLWGAGKDFTMWYVPWIMLFYVLFRLVYGLNINKNAKNLMLVIVYFIITQSLISLTNISSVWYTCNGALVMGVIISECTTIMTKRKALISMLLGIVSSILFAYLGIVTDNKGYYYIHDWAVIVSGIAFCISIYYLMMIFSNVIENTYLDKSLVGIGGISYYVYITHMKVLYFLSESNIIIFMILSISIAFLVKKCFTVLKLVK